MCTRPSEPRPRRDSRPCLRDQDETVTFKILSETRPRRDVAVSETLAKTLKLPRLSRADSSVNLICDEPVLAQPSDTLTVVGGAKLGESGDEDTVMKNVQECNVPNWVGRFSMVKWSRLHVTCSSSVLVAEWIP